MEVNRKRMKKNQKQSYIIEAEKVAEIVSDGIEKGEFLEMNNQLENLPSEGIEREQFVFESPKVSINIALIAISVCVATIFFYFLIISSAILLYSKEYIQYGKIGMAVSLLIVAFNVFVIGWQIKKIRFYRRYNKYVNVLKYRNIEIMDDLAVYSNRKIEVVEKDLKEAIHLKLIPQGHLGCDNMIILISDKINSKYLEKKAVYDRYYRKQIEERTRMQERSKKMEQIMQSGQKYVDKIHECNDIIKDKVISRKLDVMENIVSMIFHEVDINPQQADNLGLFLDYYLPTTEKLLEAYIDLDEKKVKGKSLKKAKKDIESSLDTINGSFENILDKFYQEQELDIASDISAMEVIMKQEGLADTK